MMIDKKLLGSWIGALCLAAGAFGQKYVLILPKPPQLPQAEFAQSINDDGVVTGYFLDNATGPQHGFVDASGMTTTFDVPTFGLPLTGTTFAYGINKAGAITGFFLETTVPGVSHVEGYVRDPQGKFTTFDPSGSINTQALSINAGGAITGYYNEMNLVVRGFVREPNGKITPFAAPDSVSTNAVGINDNGTITGYYQLADLSTHGFVRRAGGAIVTFDPPESTGTFVTAINNAGAITGRYMKAKVGYFGFVRRADGTFVTFAVPGSSVTGTSPTSINDEGAITGNYTDKDGLHGFVRSPGGIITSFDPPFDATQCPPRLGSPSAATFPTSINLEGVITGWCITGNPGALSRAAWIRYPR